MARALPSDDRIALNVETSYDGTGIRAARADNSALGREARAAAAELTAGATQGAAAERGLAAAARDAAQSQELVRISHEKVIELERMAGGSKERLIQLLREYREEQLALAAATRQAAAAEQQQAQVERGRIVGRITPAVGPGPVPVTAELEKIPARARTAANALSMLAFAASTGSGSLQGMAVASGTAVAGLASLTTSARLAAAASGIGALVTVLGTVLLLLNQAEEQAKSAGEQFTRSLGDMGDAAVETKFNLLDAAIQKQQALVEGLKSGASGAPGLLDQLIFGYRAMGAQSDLDKLLAQRSATLEEWNNRRRNRNRESAKDRQRDEADDARRSTELLEEMALEQLDLHEKHTLTEDRASRQKIEREYAARRAEIDALKIHEDQKTTLIAAAWEVRQAKLLELDDAAAAARRAQEEKELQDFQRRSDRALEIVQNQMESSLHAAITGREEYMRAITGMLLSPLVRYLEALAVRHAIEGGLEAIFGMWGRAGKHFAASAAAIAGAAVIARMGGLTSGGGGGGSSGVGGPSFTPEGERGGGDVTLIVQTVDPRSSAVIEETQYRLQRAGVLKKPVYAGNN